LSETNGFEHELRLDLPAAHRGVRVARSVVRRFARMQGMPKDECDAMALVLTELLGNAIDHGGGGAAMSEEDMTADVRMRLDFRVASGRWTLAVSDQGGADPDEVERLIKSAEAFDLEDDRGRGLFLLKTSVDELNVELNQDRSGLTVRVRKSFERGG